MGTLLLFAIMAIAAIVLWGCQADECLKRWLAWHDGRGSYDQVCPIDRKMDRAIAVLRGSR